MRGLWKWVALFLGVLIVAFLVALPLFGGRAAYGWMPMMGGYGSPYRLGGFGYFGGWLMMLGMFLIPIALIGLLVIGAVVLVKALSNKPQATSAPAVSPVVRTCAHCGKALQPDWAHCPYCGEKI